MRDTACGTDLTWLALFVVSCSAYNLNPLCTRAAEQSTTQWTRFHTHRGIALQTDPIFFTSACGGSTAPGAQSVHVFKHRILTRPSETTFFIQFALFNPDTAALRLDIADISLVMKGTYAQTYHSKNANDQSPTHSAPGALKPRQRQEVKVTIQRDGMTCLLRVVQYPALVRQWRCASTDIFHLHGSNVTLHKMILQTDNERNALWDFTLEPTDSESKCRPCPHGTRLLADPARCMPCITGLQVNVDMQSPWWYNARADVVPAPDWTWVVRGEPSSSGVLRYSEMTTNGNMTLTEAAKVYAYDNLVRVCKDEYDSRVFSHQCIDSQAGTTQLHAGRNVLLLHHADSSMSLSVRAVLNQRRQQTAATSWQPGDMVKFCPQALGDTAYVPCANPTILRYQSGESWSPANIDPLHTKYTRYEITSLRAGIITS